ncbi:APC family permease [Sciscionella marina]|uniref:APC family permease n=1 Tax=Sciscionella marina TaxID=508770 RepID=UPI00035D7EF7|nr:APC family permease [Sciscionella marina]
MAQPREGGSSAGFERRLGLGQATAINMTQMCGIGPFITIPLIVTAMGGPQAVIGWVVGALLALLDGLIWAELGAAMPGAGGTYLYLREAFQYRTGRLMPFLFVWTAVLSIPLIMSSGIIGLVQYLGYLWPAVVDSAGNPNVLGHVIGILLVGAIAVLLYRKVGDVSRITTVFFCIMLFSILAVVIAAYTHFHPDLAFTFPKGSFSLGGHFWMGLGAGLMLAIYDYLGYYTTAYMGAEIRNPGRNLPRSIIISVIGIMLLYLLLQIGVLGAVPWQEIAHSNSAAALVLERTWGSVVAKVLTVFIVITAFASVFAGLLGGSRVPYEAAKDRVFLPWFGKLHPRLRFPHVGLLVLGVITALGSLLDLSTVISMLNAVIVVVQAVAQAVALIVLRRRQPELRRPYKQWLYPVPCVLAILGWIYVYISSGTLAIVLSLIWLAVGVSAFLIWARVERTWPFGPKDIQERFLGQDPVQAG